MAVVQTGNQAQAARGRIYYLSSLDEMSQEQEQELEELAIALDEYESEYDNDLWMELGD